MPKERFKTYGAWWNIIKEKNKWFISMKEEQWILWIDLESKEPSRRKFEANAIKLKMEFAT